MKNPYITYMDRAEADEPKGEPKHDGLALASIVFAFLFFPLGIVFGHLSYTEARRAGRCPSALATAGLWVSYLALSGTALVIITAIATAANH